MVKTILYVLPSEKYFDGVIKILKKESKRKVIYVTTNKPYDHIMTLFKKAGIKTDNLFFIDCISRYVSSEKGEAKNCLYLEGGPGSTMGMSIAITKAIGLLQGEKLVVLDSLSTILIYSDEVVVGKFSNFLINKLRTLDISAAILILDSDVDRKVIRVIGSFVDEVKKGAS